MNRNKYTKTSMILYFMSGSKRWFILAALCTCMVSVFDMVNPRLIQYILDEVITKNIPVLPKIVVTIVIVAAAAALFRYLFKLTNSIGAEKLVKHMRDSLFSHIMELPYSWYKENRTGDIIQRCTSDVETVKNFLSEQLTELVRTLILITFAVICMFNISITLSLISLIFIPVIVIYSLIFFKKIGNAFETADESEGRLSSMVQENLTGVRVVRAFGRERYETDKFTDFNNEYTGMWVHLMKILSEYWAVGDFFTSTQILICVVMGCIYCVDGILTPGEIVAFISYNSMMVWPVRQLGRVISEMSKASVSIDRIRYIMNSESEEEISDTAEINVKTDPVVRFSSVNFSYPDAEAGIFAIKDMSLEIKMGETVGILGATGSGKSTLMLLLCGLYPLKKGIDSGHITVFGRDISEIDKKALRNRVSIVLQEPYLFSRTLYENLCLGKDSATKEAVEAAAETAALDVDFDTFVGEKGVTLSGGQKQRAAIATVLIKNPDIMIFDDSLSAVDAATEKKIRRNLIEKTRESTVIIISHRISTIMHADRIFVLSNGSLIESGNHHELLQKKGVYRSVYDLQTSV